MNKIILAAQHGTCARQRPGVNAVHTLRRDIMLTLLGFGIGAAALAFASFS